MKTALIGTLGALALVLVLGTSSDPAKTPAARVEVGQFQLAQAGSRTGKGCPKNYRYDYRSQQCVRV